MAAISGPQGQTPDRRDDGEVLRVHNCSRIGLQANPPRARLGNLLGRR